MRGVGTGLLLAVVLLVMTATSACDLTSSVEIEPEDVIVVEAYLRAGLDPGAGPSGTSQEVFVYRTLPRNEGSLRVDSATVEVMWTGLYGGEQRAVLVPVPSQVCAASEGLLPEVGSCYMSSFYVEPGGTYTLRVTTADGRELTGTTKVPGDFALQQPATNSCVVQPDEQLELVWTQSEGARSYIIEGAFTGLAAGLADQGVADPPDELDLTGLAVGQADTTLVFPRELGVFDRFSLDRDVALAMQQGLPTGASADIVIAAGDQNSVNWVRGGSFNPSGQVRVPSIAGDGTGVFGSLVTQRVTILSQNPEYPACQ